MKCLYTQMTETAQHISAVPYVVYHVVSQYSTYSTARVHQRIRRGSRICQQSRSSVLQKLLSQQTVVVVVVVMFAPYSGNLKLTLDIPVW